MTVKVKYVPISKNKKTGCISQTYSEPTTCPTSCPFKNNGCYAQGFPTCQHWKQCNTPVEDLKAVINGNPSTFVIRHNVAGDIAKQDTCHIDNNLLDVLMDAYSEHLAYTYTHCVIDDKNIALVKKALDNNFIINFSTEKPHKAIEALKAGCPAVIAVWSMKQDETVIDGVKFKKCPANKKNITCMSCKQCWNKQRDYVIVFPCHGNAGQMNKLKALFEKGVLVEL